MTAEEVWISIGVVFLVFVIVKQLWDPIPLGLGVRQRVQDQLKDAVERLEEMRMELDYLDRMAWQTRWGVDPTAWHRQWMRLEEIHNGWKRRERDLRAKVFEAAAGHSGWGLLIPSNYLGNEELKEANDLIQEGKQLLEEEQAQARSRPVLHVLRSSDCEGVRDVLEGLPGSGSRLVGIFGMPGVGKTFLLQLLFRESQSPAVEEASPFFFDHVLFVRAGRGATVGTMQKAIATGLGLTSRTDDEIYQRSIIYNHLKDTRFLLLIDDLRGYHDLKRVGIPMPLGSVRIPTDAHAVDRRRCLRKVVFTTRSYDVCVKMGCAYNTFLLQGWCRGYRALNLFDDKLGNDEIIYNYWGYLIKGNPFESIEQLVDECRGLPLALSTIGRAMSTKKDPKKWERAIDLVKKLKLRHTIIMSHDMYSPNRHGSSSSVNRRDDGIENDLEELRKATDPVDTSDDGLLKTVLALVVMLTPVPRDRIIRYIRLKEIELPSLHGMASYQMKVLGFVEGDCSLLGIWGVRGVGKTTLLRFVRDYAHDLFPYDAFFLGAGPGCTVRQLQHALCVNIGLDPPPPPPPPHHMSYQASLAQLISNSLEDKPFMLLVDDVRERLDLAAIGVPMPLRHNQKVIFTTWNPAVCTEMGCTEATSIIHMECLGKEDARSLFKDKVGDEIIDDHPQIRRLAKQMVAACHGLPSVLCTLGRAMSTKRDVKEWRYAHDVLLKMKPPHQDQVDEIQEMEDERYSHLYHLQDKLLKHSVF